MDPLLAKGPRQGPFGFLVGAYAVIWGLSRMVSDKKLRGLATVPLALTAVLYLLAVMSLVVLGDDLMRLVWTQPESTWLLVFWWMATVLLVVGALLVLVLLFSTIAEAIGGAFYDKMAIRVLHGHDLATREPGLIEGTVPDIFRSLIFVVATLFFGVLGLVPVVGVPFVVLGTACAWLGFASGAVNPALMVTEHKLGARLGWLRTYLFTALGLGAVVAAAMLMPFLGLLALPASIVGAAELHAQALVRQGAMRRRGR